MFFLKNTILGQVSYPKGRAQEEANMKRFDMRQSCFLVLRCMSPQTIKTAR
jgi:hypothetical protein